MPTKRRKRTSPAERLRKHAPKGAPNDCWEWKAKARHWYGYGVLNLGTGERNMLAHRLAFTLEHGPIPEGMKVLHKCDNPPCTNPAHLFLGSQGDNVRDAATKGRISRGDRHTHAKLGAHQVRCIRKMYVDHGWFQRELAVLYGVGQSAISQIVNRKLWKHI